MCNPGQRCVCSSRVRTVMMDMPPARTLSNDRASIGGRTPLLGWFHGVWGGLMAALFFSPA
jgi:hypothetical protein